MSEHKKEYHMLVTQEHMDKVDKNPQDGEITWEEHWFDVTDGHNFGEAQIEDLTETETKLFAEHDENQDGRLDIQELNDLLFPDITKMDFVGAQAGHIHEIADEDKDGKLSLAEMKQHAEMVIGGLSGSGHEDL